jgi:hypothetical protein
VLRALIGRSKEPLIQVELELLSSISEDVCELWDGNQIVRLAGTPEILELVFDQVRDILPLSSPRFDAKSQRMELSMAEKMSWSL